MPNSFRHLPVSRQKYLPAFWQEILKQVQDDIKNALWYTRIMNKRLLIFFLGSSVFLFFVVFSYLVHKDLFTQIDFDMTVKLQDNISRRFDGIFSFFSEVGSFEPVTIFLLILLLIRRKLKGILVLVLYGVFHLIEIYGKVFVNHFPPPEFMLRTERLIEFPQFHIRTENSYPSGHAGRALFVSLILMLLIGDSKKIPKTMKLFIFGALTVYDIVMLVSRVYLGEHWFSDVMGGSFLGAGLALIGIIAL